VLPVIKNPFAAGNCCRPDLAPRLSAPSKTYNPDYTVGCKTLITGVLKSRNAIDKSLQAHESDAPPHKSFTYFLTNAQQGNIKQKNYKALIEAEAGHP